jgi:hypothetical protein
MLKRAGGNLHYLPASSVGLTTIFRECTQSSNSDSNQATERFDIRLRLGKRFRLSSWKAWALLIVVISSLSLSLTNLSNTKSFAACTSIVVRSACFISLLSSSIVLEGHFDKFVRANEILGGFSEMNCGVVANEYFHEIFYE